MTIFTTMHPQHLGQPVPLDPEIVALIADLKANPPAPAPEVEVDPRQARATAQALGLDAADYQAVANHLAP